MLPRPDLAKPDPASTEASGSSNSLQFIMALAAGLGAANIYYNQPMLSGMARSFHTSAGQAGLVATATQIGYALGMPVFVPLGDLLPRRGLLVTMFLFIAVAMALAALSPNLPSLVVASFVVGLTSVVAQVMIPLASDLSTPERAGHTVGVILSGVLLCILLARTISGSVSEHFGWRAMFWTASGIALLFAPILRTALPHIAPKSRSTYPELMRSLVALVCQTPALRQISLLAALFFAAFSAFWTTIVFFLEKPPYHYGSQVAGLFGLIGAVGAAVAPIAGRLSDRHSPRYVVRIAIGTVLASFVLFAALGTHLWALVAGVILLDAGIQAAQVANQTGVMVLHPHARSRVNTFYMLCYFGGGSLGSLVASYVWSGFGWLGVCTVGIVSMVLAIMAMHFHGTSARRRGE